MDFAAKILGVRASGKDIKYLLMFKPRRDGKVVMPAEFSKDELMERWSSVLGDFLLDRLTISGDSV
jgi:hypothetical protein